MRILLVSDSYPPLIGGATRATQQLGRELAQRGHKVTVATVWQRDCIGQEADAGVSVHRLRTAVSRIGLLSADPTRYTPPPFPDPELVLRLRRLVLRVRPEVIHSYGWITYSLVLATMGLHIPLVLSARDYGYICALRTLVQSPGGDVCSGPATRKCLSCAGSSYGRTKGVAAVVGVRLGRRLLKTSVAVQTPSSYTSGMMKDHLGETDQDAVIPDFRDASEPAPDAALLAQLPGEPYILFVGAFRRVKGVDLLLSAYADLPNAPPLVMIGGLGPEGLPHTRAGVLILTDVPHASVLAAWDRALFGVFPSIVPETLGNVVHEAMSCGKAVIGTKPGGHSDMIRDGDTGLLVTGGDRRALLDAMKRLIHNPQEREEMGVRARLAAEQFTSIVVVPTFEALLARTVAESGERSSKLQLRRSPDA